ncbi:hypothetical protein BBBOND_0202300 [Babesia bigemina]|uniref:6-Cys domain-containing protein n=1 Tax=Babesia bigemina TaxID=5866 RepID=A0A061D393_BABBI|nr:hypothetical protein BBBOND_0202300 [Babesia bigemina]CDR95073.1 hypothetical protein BBBOND_0202300 [Babesia bigemina]|eukprot:XP_012767259.1 hypothetical protein BBBOND_0202300 [Babesia bigemina]
MARDTIHGSLWIFCAIWLYFIRGIYAIDCDFGGPRALLSNKALVACHYDLNIAYNVSASCPSRVNDTEYVWHPQPRGGRTIDLNTYVGENGKINSIAISEVMPSEAPRPLIWLESIPSQSILHLDLPSDELYVIKKRRLIYICAPKNLVLSDALQGHLDGLSGPRVVEIPWTSNTPLTDEIKQFGAGLGVLFLYRNSEHLPFQGCGSRPSPLFAPDNEVDIDPETGTRSCVADPMSESPIGFLCEGIVAPYDCMISLVDKHGKVVKAPRPHSHRTFGRQSPWVVSKYFSGFSLPPINGRCYCIDNKTYRVIAKIDIRPKTEYVCDIASMLKNKHAKNISGPWCSVVLHPGSTLTIKLPKQIVKSGTINRNSEEVSDTDYSTDALSQVPSAYEYEANILPHDLNTMRELNSYYDLESYDEILSPQTLIGDALELDVSQIDHGEVKLKYHPDMPLTSKGNQNSFFFHYVLKCRDEKVMERIRAIVKISLALTHEYHIIGCDRGPQSIFDPNISTKHCSVKSMGNGIGDVYECRSRIEKGFKPSGIHCRPDEELLPANSESKVYDVNKNKIVSIPVSLESSNPRGIPGFKVLKFKNLDRLSTYAFICVDKNGYETSRLVLERMYESMSAYNSPNQKLYNRMMQSMLFPPVKVSMFIEGFASGMSLRIRYAHMDRLTLFEGETMTLSCENGSDGFRVPNLLKVHNSQQRTLKWLPENPHEYHYTGNHTIDGLELSLTGHNDSIVTTPGGFSVAHHYATAKEHLLKITTRMDAVIVSKTSSRKLYVPMMFVCGKVPKSSDSSTITGEAPALGASPPSSPVVLGSSSEDTWHVVEVDIMVTDPYMHGCGVTYESTQFFKPETPKLYDAIGQNVGCKIDFQDSNEAAFYCPAPYVLDPPGCFNNVFVDGIVKNVEDLSDALVASRTSHFVTLKLESKRVGPGETLRRTPPLECRCVTIKGIVLSTIQIENYYAKELVTVVQ